MATTVTFKGNPVELVGNPPQPGQDAPDFSLITPELSLVTLADLKGKVVVLSAVPSIDTSVCSLETKHFNQDLESMPNGVAGYTVSVDTPFAQKRWCAAEGVERMKMLSDFRGQRFGYSWGLYIESLGLLARCVFVLDRNGKISYTQLVPEIAQEPDYEAVLAHARSLAGG